MLWKRKTEKVAGNICSPYKLNTIGWWEMKRRKGSKESAQKEHFKRRMAGRFDLDITNKDIDDIVNLIQTGQTTIVEKQSLRVVIHQIEYKGELVNIPYDKQRKVPITALFDEETWDENMYGG